MSCGDAPGPHLAWHPYPGFIQLNRPFSTDPVLIRANHRSPQFVQHLKRRLVASEAELPLKLKGAHTGSLSCDKVGRPEPYLQWLSRAVHDGARCKAGLVAAVTTFEYMGAGQKPPWLLEKSACRAFKTFRPADMRQMTCAGLLIGEVLLELHECLGEVGHASDCATKDNLWQPEASSIDQ